MGPFSFAFIYMPRHRSTVATLRCCDSGESGHWGNAGRRLTRQGPTNWRNLRRLEAVFLYHLKRPLSGREVSMAKPLQFQIVERARALIADEQRWCRGHLAQTASGLSVFPTSATAVKRCGLGAVIAAAYQLTHDHDAANALAHKALRPLYGTATLVRVNDMRGHAAVLALFDEVIAAERY
jgi:hypothetical protein